MKINVTHEKPESGKVVATVAVDAKEVDAIINQTYADIARRYNFQGFRRGKAPRPVIDSMIGREAILADATNTLVGQVEPLMIEELNVVPLTEVNYGEDPKLVEAGKPYEIVATIAVRPDAELTSYEPVAIDMPPAEATEAEIDAQVELLRGYHTTYEDIEEEREVTASDVISIDVENVLNGEAWEGKDRMLNMATNGLPEAFDTQIVGMKPGETKDVEWAEIHEHEHEGGTETHAHPHHVKVTVNSIKKAVVPELDDEFVKRGFGFETVAELRDAVRDEINSDKGFTLPNVKENRCVAAIAERLGMEELPEVYVNNIYSEIISSFLNQLERQGTTLDNYLQMAGVTVERFLEDTRVQADERARQSLALDALAEHLGLKVEDADIEKEFTEAGMEDPKASKQEFIDNGRLTAVREAILRSKALEWLVETAVVTEVDEAAKAAAAEESAEEVVEAAEAVAEAAEEVLEAAEAAAEEAPAEEPEAAEEPAEE